MLEVEPESAGRSVLMAVVAPTLVWALVALLIGAAIRHVSVTPPRWQQKPGTDRRRRVLVLVLPTVGYALLGTVLLLAVPLGAACHFAPDIGWGATILAYLTITWALARAAVTINALRSARTSRPPLQDPSCEPPPTTPLGPTDQAAQPPHRPSLSVGSLAAAQEPTSGIATLLHLFVRRGGRSLRCCWRRRRRRGTVDGVDGRVHRHDAVRGARPPARACRVRPLARRDA
jgi:hypothetical protein